MTETHTLGNVQTRVNGRVTGRGSRAGFSLLELTLVLVILGLLSAVAAVAIGPAAERAKVRTTKASMETIKTQIQVYEAENSAVPASLETLAQQGYLEEQKLLDGWKQAFYFEATPEAVAGGGRAFKLLSSGQDKQWDTEDDIDVWTMNLETEAVAG